MTDNAFSPLEHKTRCQKWQRNWHQERSLIGGKKRQNKFPLFECFRDTLEPKTKLHPSELLLLLVQESY